jgi:hypothetical protein
MDETPVDLRETTVFIAIPVSKLRAVVNLLNVSDPEESGLSAATLADEATVFEALASVLDGHYGAGEWIEEAAE